MLSAWQARICKKRRSGYRSGIIRKRHARKFLSEFSHQRFLMGEHPLSFLWLRVDVTVQMQQAMHHVPEEFPANGFVVFHRLANGGIIADDDFPQSVSMREGDNVRFRGIIQKTGMHIPDGVIIHDTYFHFLQTGEDGNRAFGQGQYGRLSLIHI